MPVSHKHASRRPAGSGRSGVCAGQADAHRCWRVCGWLVRQGRCPRASKRPEPGLGGGLERRAWRGRGQQPV